MTKKQERHIIASVGTVLFMLLLFLLLWFMRLYSVKEEEQEGIEVAFGEVAEAGGYMAEQSEAVPLPAPQPVAPAPAAASSDNDLMTQEDEEALALKREQEKQERERKKAEAAEKQRQREEQARLEAEQRQREKEAAEKKAKEDAAIAKANQFGSLFGQSGNATGSGDSQGSGQKGHPSGGEGVFNGNKYSLKGRKPKDIPNPDGYFNENAKVVVQIRVNENGDVVSAKWTTGTQNASQSIIKMAETAALKSKWDAVPGAQDQVGTIEYIFSVK